MAILKPISLPLETLKFQKIRTSSPNSSSQICNSHFPCKPISSLQFDSSIEARRMVEEFNPKIPLQEAFTPPSSWYTEPSFHELELNRVFYRGWQAVGYTEQIKNSQDFFTGRLGSVQFVVCRDTNGKVHAFHNVCRHHASLVASGSGQKSCFVCPYHGGDAKASYPGQKNSHTPGLYEIQLRTRKTPPDFGIPKILSIGIMNKEGWTYGLDGALLKATRISGIRNFKVNEFGLIPLQVATWGPFVLVNLDEDTQHQQNCDSKMVENEWLGSSSEILSTGGIDSSLSFVCRREYTIDCNWKVFCDNYLDGGYHVPYAHTGLASGLQLDSYSTTLFEKVSIQACESGSEQKGDDFDRLGSKALYAFIYPNFMINRYGPWMDTNLVLPLGPSKCQVIFDYFLEVSLKDDKAFINQSLEESERVQMEDIALCEGVQKGLKSPAYACGRYAPTVEKAMHHFHCLLYETLSK